jgi:branched-chain amino acid transport system permease protein
MTIFTLTFFLAYLVESLLSLIWGNEYRAITTQYTGTSILLGSFYISTTRLVTFLIAVIALVVLALFIRYTYTGKALQAIGQNREGGSIVGINVKRLHMLTFAISLATASLAGTFLALIYTFYPSLQSEWMGKLYAIIIIGGMGSITGSLIAAMIIGILEATIALFLPSMWGGFFMWTLLMLTLLVRPSGLLGKK